MTKKTALKKFVLYRLLSLIVITALIVIFAMVFVNLYETKVAYPLKYKKLVLENSKIYNLDKYMLFAIINTESGFNADAKSNKGAIGLMQLTTSTANYIAVKHNILDYDLTNPMDNVKIGCLYINYLQNKFEDFYTVMTAYNAGEGNVSIWLKNKEYSSDGRTLKIIPFKETDEYIYKIKKSFEKYKNLYSHILDK
ncbi:MAG: lytic transglycosylase domain-containing protein [Clostridiales bacterium]|nr:lytic transglycosylase domain-containing protein [Clostridiales bacterium]